MVGHCELHSGSVLTVEYTPVADVLLPTVVSVGTIVGITTRPILANQLGGLNVGGGVYRFTANGIIAAGVETYFDNTTKKATATAGAIYLGKSVTASTGDGAEILVMHLQKTPD